MLNSPKHISGCTYIWRFFKSPYWNRFHVEWSTRHFYFWYGMYVPQPIPWQHPLVQWTSHPKACEICSSGVPYLSHRCWSIAWLYNKLIPAKTAVGERLLMYLLAHLPLLPSISSGQWMWARRDSSLLCLWGYETHIYNLSTFFSTEKMALLLLEINREV